MGPRPRPLSAREPGATSGSVLSPEWIIGRPTRRVSSECSRTIPREATELKNMLRRLFACCAFGLLPAAHALTLAPDAPERYVVKAGDTLWSLAGKYLTDPWSWPELWHAGAGIDNPNRIYPGDVLTLVRDENGQPILTRASAEPTAEGETVRLSPQMRAQSLQDAIATIPYDMIAAFMSKPSLLPADGAGQMPYVVGFDHDRLAGAMGSRVYVRGLGPEPGDRFALVHVGEKIRDPASSRVIGYQATYTGSARLEEPAKGRHGVASLTLITSARETLPGDRVVAEGPESRLDFTPHLPTQPVDAQIASVIDGVRAIGQYQVILLNQGRRAGLEPGHILTLWHEPGSLVDHGPGGPAQDSGLSSARRRSVPLPAEAAGSLLVFRTYPDASYALVLETNSELMVGDHARTPHKNQ